MTTVRNVFFPGLNGLRFFAALAVIITHIELIKMYFGIPHLWNDPLFFRLGGMGVEFFFALSGFLITYLLYTELKTTGKIAIKAFYLRRIFRIWPLYYLIFIIGFFVLPHISAIHIPNYDPWKETYWTQLLSYLAIFPNLGYAIGGPVPHIGQSWSIGVEEQFYILWPWLIARFKPSLKLFIGTILALLMVKVATLFLLMQFPTSHFLLVLKEFLAMSKMECMAIGGIAAYLLFFDKQRWLKWIYHPVVNVASWATVILLVYFTPDLIQDGIHLVYGAAFAVILVNVSTNKGYWLKMENKVFDFLGRISYGLYMYHFMIIPMVLVWIMNPLRDKLSVGVWNGLFYVLVIALSIGVSALSYQYFEKAFLRLKRRYTIISSGDRNPKS